MAGTQTTPELVTREEINAFIQGMLDELTSAGSYDEASKIMADDAGRFGVDLEVLRQITGDEHLGSVYIGIRMGEWLVTRRGQEG